MFNYDKLAKKLGKFNELPNKKQKKILESILCSDDFRNWFYGVGDSANEQPMTKPMVNKIFGSLANPITMKRVIKFINNKSCEEFDHTACSIGFLIVEQAIETSNLANKEISEGYKSGDLASKEAKEYKAKSDQYNEYISDLMRALRDKARSEVKEICRKSNLPKGMVYTTYFMVPGRKYIPRNKIGLYMNQLLQEIYKWTGNSGVEDVSSIKWGSFFGNFFGSEMTSSAAITILLEGVRRIDNYRNTEYFDNVREVWDSLTNFAMVELDRAPENVRRQMIELYTKRIDRIFHNGNGPRLRVDMLNIPNNFQNLANTVSRYADRISKITRGTTNHGNNSQKNFEKKSNEGNPFENFMNNSKNNNTKVSVNRDDDTDDEDVPSLNFVSDDEDEDEDDE